ncbi:DNA recombination protein RmuC [Jannaschia sp. R86511]|uniref:DNA recombination protein RmuC n=1 Tax=Jannaschia sp. R86511 TaxID=3093853 RepID=UPI0036D4324D
MTSALPVPSGAPPAWLLVALVAGLLVGLLLGTGLGAALGRSRAAALRAGVTAERDLLAARVESLETALEDRASQEQTLAPLSSTLARVERQVAVLERDRVAQYAGLREQLSGLALTNEALRTQTAALAGALRSPNARGSWGEVQLRRVVEHAGMLERVDFTEQATGTSRSGATVRPDLVVHLPGGKHVVVDAKAPLSAFLEQRYDDHAKAVRGHVDALAGKQYWTAFTDSPEIVVCFVPGEAFLAAACQADPSLLEAAMAKRVVLATPTTLLALLRTVALTWQQDALAGSARQLFDVGRELHARLGTLGGHTGKLGRDLQRTVEGYNALVSSLESRVLVTARRMRDLGVVDDDLAVVAPLEVSPRPLTAPELIDDVLGGPGPDDDGHDGLLDLLQEDAAPQRRSRDDRRTG